MDGRAFHASIFAILIVLSSSSPYATNALGKVSSIESSQASLNSEHGTSSGLLLPEFKAELRTLPSAHPHSSVQSFPINSIKVDSSPTPTQTVLSGQSSSSVAVSPGFDGLNQIQSCACVPPDVQLAAGPSQLVEMVNLEGEVFTKQGVTNKTFSLATFFRSGLDSISDPKILYDASSGRWFSTLADITARSILLAVSSTSDPNGVWVFYALSAGTALPDQPILGISDDKVAIASNNFSSRRFLGSQFWILNKSQLLAGIAANFFTPGANSGEFSIHPVQSLGSTTTQFMISNIVTLGALSTTSLRLFSVTGVPGVSTVTVVTTDLPISTIGTVGGTVPGGVQPGTSATVNTNDIRTQDAVWYKNTLWLGFDDACTPAGDTQARSCIRLTKITTTSPAAVSQDFDFGASSQYYYYPALRVDNSGDLLLVFGYSNTTTYPSLAVTSQLITGPANSLAPPQNLKLGSAADTSTRYGDYFGAALDPVDPTTVWFAGEYHDIATGSCQSFGSCWSTFIGSASTTTGFTVAANPNSLNLSAVTGANSNITLTSIGGFAGPVSVTTTRPSGVSVSPIQATANLTSSGITSVKLAFSVTNNLAPGNYPVTVDATSGAVSRATSLTLVVHPDFNVSIGCPCRLNTVPGTQIRENITVTSIDGFSGTVALNATILPILNGGTTIFLSRANVTLSSGGSVVATLTITGGNVTASFTVALAGACLLGSCTSPVQQHTVSVLVASRRGILGGGGLGLFEI